MAYFRPSHKDGSSNSRNTLAPMADSTTVSMFKYMFGTSASTKNIKTSRGKNVCHSLFRRASRNYGAWDETDEFPEPSDLLPKTTSQG